MREGILERRACERFIIPGAVVNYRAEGFFFSGKYIEEAFPVFDVSRGGMRFLGNVSLKVDAKVTVKITIPDGEGPLILKGWVRWISINPEKSYKYQIGIQFAPYGSKIGNNSPEILQKMIALEEQYLRGHE